MLHGFRTWWGMPPPIQAGGQQQLALRALELCGSQGTEFN